MLKNNKRLNGDQNPEVQHKLGERISEIASLRRLGEDIEKMLEKKKDVIMEEMKIDQQLIEGIKLEIRKIKKN